MADRVLFRVPNALEVKRPMPVPLGPTAEQFGLFLFFLFGTIAWLFVDLFADREIGPDLQFIGQLVLLAGVYLFWRPQGHRLPYWFYLGCRQIGLRLIGRLSWGLWPRFPTSVARDLAGQSDSGAVLISGPWAHALYANARVEDDGIVDVSGLPLPWLSLLRGQAPYRAVIRVPIASVSDLSDAMEQEAAHARRSRMWFKLGMPASAHVLIDPLDPEAIAYCAGPNEDDARALALGTLQGQVQGLVQRAGYLVIPGATRGLLRDRIDHVCSVLSEAGRDPVVCRKDELNAILDREWGENRNFPIGISGDGVRLAGRRWVSYLITRLERTVPLEVLAPLLDGTLQARVGLYSWPVATGSAKLMLQVRQALWQAAAWTGGQEYSEALADAEQVQTEIRNQGSLHHFSLVITVPESQREMAEKSLRVGYIEHAGWHRATRRQDSAARAALPLHEPGFLDRRLTNAGTLALLTPWSGSGMWVPPGADGKPHAVLIGHALATAEVVGHDLFNEDIQDAWSVFTWGQMGAGKTVTMQALTLRICDPHPKHYLAEMRPRAFIVDHKEDFEWGPLVKHLGGEYIIASSWDDVRGIDVDQRCLGVNVSRIPIAKRGRFVDDLHQLQWDLVARRPTSEPWPGVIVEDEMSALAMSRVGRQTINRLGKMARSAYWAVMFGTQEMADVLRHDETAGVGTDGLVAAAIKNSPTRVALRQPSMDRILLRDRLGLSEAELDFLIHMGSEDGARAGKTRGQCLLWAQGRAHPVPTQVVVLPHERPIFAMNPQARRAAFAGTSEGERNGTVDRRPASDRAARLASVSTRIRRRSQVGIEARPVPDRHRVADQRAGSPALGEM